MNKDIIKKLLNSANLEDVLLGLNYSKNLSFAEFVDLLPENTKYYERQGFYNWRKDGLNKLASDIQVNKEIYLSVWSGAVFIYNEDKSKLYKTDINL